MINILRKRIKEDCGFTFLEVLFSVLILSFVLIQLLVWSSLGVDTSVDMRQKTEAVLLCQAKIEQLRQQILRNSSINYAVDNATFNPPNEGFRYTIEDNSTSGYKNISVKVWNNNRPKNEATLFVELAER